MCVVGIVGHYDVPGRGSLVVAETEDLIARLDWEVGDGSLVDVARQARAIVVNVPLIPREVAGIAICVHALVNASLKDII